MFFKSCKTVVAATLLLGSLLAAQAAQPFDAKAGTIVFLPRGTRHRITSTGASPGRLLSFAAPGGIDAFFEEIADPSVRLGDAFRKHGFVFDDP